MKDNNIYITTGFILFLSIFGMIISQPQKNKAPIEDRITCTSPLSIYTDENGAQSCLTDKEYSDIISSRFSRVGDDERGVDCYILDEGKANQTMSCIPNRKTE